MKEIMMSEEQAIESDIPTVDDVLKAIQDKNLARAKAHFNDVMSAKVNTGLESEKVRMANVVFNGAPEEEVDEPEVEAEGDLDLESEVEDAFEEEEEVEE